MIAHRHYPPKTMFDYLKKLVRPAPEPGASAGDSESTTNKADARPTDQASSPAPPRPTAEPDGENDSAHNFIRREPVLDRQQRIAGYEFTLQERLRSRLLKKSDLLQKVYDDALLRNLCGAEAGSLLGQRLSFIRISPGSLDNVQINSLPKKNTVLILSPGQQGLDLPTITRQLVALDQAGMAYGWMLRKKQIAEYPALLNLAAASAFIEVKTRSFDGMEIRTLLRDLRQAHNTLTSKPSNTGAAPRSGPRPPAKLIARELETFDDFHLCFQSGFDYFHGPFIASRDNWHPPQSEHNRVHLLEILNLLRQEAEFAVIAEHLKREPVLSFKLLRYINSPAMGLQRPVDNMVQALTLIGREKFFRWMSLLLFDVKTPSYREQMLTEQALSRARFLENLAGQGQIPRDKDPLFLLGLFSLIDVLLDRPLAEILQQAKVPTAVQEALLGQPGPWLDALQLAIAAQEHDYLATDGAAKKCAVDALLVSRASIEALSWASQLTGLDHT